MATARRALLLLACLLLLSLALASTHPVIRTRQGAVRGTTRQAHSGRQFLAFYNLPFAKPPVGELRFREPLKPEPWVHVRDASQPGPACTQNVIFRPSLPPLGTEDCLYLNVFTPKEKHEELLPVLVWIHGGGLVSGAATWYEPDYIMEQDVVLVSTNYRVGVLGFFSTGDPAAPGNFGFKDQVAALRWVKENIEAFGGDPGSVTIFGESAGGASVHYLMLSPLTKGLFHRSIAQSGVALMPWATPDPDAPEKARRVAEHLGCPTEPSTALVDCLRTKDNYEVSATEALFFEWNSHPSIPFRPAVECEGEDSFLPKHPVDLEPHSALPWIVGVTEDEGLLFTADLHVNKTAYEELERYRDRLLPLTLLYHKSPNAKLITKLIMEFYFPSDGLDLNKLTEVYSDGYFTYGTDEAIRRYKDRAPVYYYNFAYKGKYRLSHMFAGKDKDLGTAHGDDLLYLFSNISFYPTPPDRPEKDVEIRKTMVKLWAQFAKSGNPTPGDEPIHWPRVTSDDGLEYLQIGQELEVRKGLFQERINFWRSLPLRETVDTRSSKDEL